MDLLVTGNRKRQRSQDRSISHSARVTYALEQIASAVHSFPNHFHADPDSLESARHLYICSGSETPVMDVQTAILVLSLMARPADCITCRLEPQFNGLPEESAPDLIAVAPRVQGVD